MKNGFISVAAATPHICLCDCKKNAEQFVKTAKDAVENKVKILVFPELSLTGYTCSDLFLSDTLVNGALDALKYYIDNTAEYDLVSLVGLPVQSKDKLYNCAAVCCGGRLLGLVPKSNIPSYAEFYEGRHFAPSPDTVTEFEFDGYSVPLGSKILFECKTVKSLTLGVEICEDLWVSVPPSAALAEAGATVIANLSASNETVGKDSYRLALVNSQSARIRGGYIYANCGEGESTTDLVFSGHSVISENGIALAERKPFDFSFGELLISEIDTQRIVHERLRINTHQSNNSNGYVKAGFSLKEEETPLTRKTDAHPFVPSDTMEREKRCETILSIQSQGLKQRIERSYAKKCVVGISGGLDSCLALLITVRAVDSLGLDRKSVLGVTMPCFGTTSRTKSNAEKLCSELGIDFKEVNITDAVNVHFKDIGHDSEDRNVVYENAQARERTQVLMDLANSCNGLVIGTGDLSELALGWATYNGDHMSMYGVNASVPKTLVRHIVSYCADKAEAGAKSELAAVLRDILATPVSPELLPADNKGNISQVTEDIVGPYEIHDFYLYNMVRFGFTPDKLFRLACRAFDGVYDKKTLLHWLEVFLRRFFAQQFKRSCLPDGPKVGSVALSPRGDWRMPSDASSALWLSYVEELKKTIK